MGILDKVAAIIDDVGAIGAIGAIGAMVDTSWLA